MNDGVGGIQRVMAGGRRMTHGNGLPEVKGVNNTTYVVQSLLATKNWDK